MTTRPITARKPSVRATAAKKPTAATVTAAKAVKPAARKSTVRRAAVTKTVARKPVSSIVAKNLNPVVAKSVSAVAKAKPVAAKPAAKPKKVKLVRATFSFPEHEHDLLVDLKKRAKKIGKDFKKSEFLRAGIAHLVSLSDTVLVNALSKVERIKTGRPAKKGKKK